MLSLRALSLTAGFVVVSAFVSPVVALAQSECGKVFAVAASEKRAPLVRFDAKTFEFKGLTTEGVAALKQARDIVRERMRIFRNDLRNLDTVGDEVPV